MDLLVLMTAYVALIAGITIGMIVKHGWSKPRWWRNPRRERR